MLCRFPKVQKQTVVHKTFQFLTVAIITDANNWNFGDLYAGNKICNSSSISSRHSIDLIHYKDGFGMFRPATKKQTFDISQYFLPHAQKNKGFVTNQSMLTLRDSLLTSSLMELALLPPIPLEILLSAFPRLSLAFT